MTPDDLLRELLDARARRERCALVTVAAARGSTPREAGAKMLVYAGGRTAGTVGGGRLESLVIEESLAALRANARAPVLKAYPLREGLSESFGAVCGGEVTVLIEPQVLAEALFIVGAGHCGLAIARLAVLCGWHVTVLDDRVDLLGEIPAGVVTLPEAAPAGWIAAREWQRDEALALVSRSYPIDRDCLLAALRRGGMGYLGMMGSGRKVRLAFEEARAAGVPAARLAEVYAPLGLDLHAETPAEIAVSVLAQIFQVMRGAPGGHLVKAPWQPPVLTAPGEPRES